MVQSRSFSKTVFKITKLLAQQTSNSLLGCGPAISTNKSIMFSFKYSLLDFSSEYEILTEKIPYNFRKQTSNTANVIMPNHEHSQNYIVVACMLATCKGTLKCHTTWGDSHNHETPWPHCCDHTCLSSLGPHNTDPKTHCTQAGEDLGMHTNVPHICIDITICTKAKTNHMDQT